jgi:hypothetical protein
MALPSCKARHECADGGEGECSQPDGHRGRHLCKSCMDFFGAREAIDHGRSPIQDHEVQIRETPGDIPETTEYICAHCPSYKALSTKRCPLCKNLICYHCDVYNCPTQFKKCAHCGYDIPALGPNKTCIYCGYEICDKCYYSMFTCPKAPKCHHCGNIFTSENDRYVCYCNNMAHLDCRERCPMKPADGA